MAVAAIAMIVFALNAKETTPKPTPGSEAAIAKMTNVPPSTLEKVGIPDGLTPANPLPPGTAPVEADGKPMVLYFGAEYCPYCAAERWPMTVALSRFGTFSDLSTTTSAADDIFPNTPTVTYYGSSYASDYITLSTVETETNEPAPGGGYTKLQTPTAQQQELFSTYNTEQYTGSSGGIPFVMIGNLYAWAGASYDPAVLEGKSFDRIANELWIAKTDVAQAINGSANMITAQICRLTGNQPADVCSASYIQQAQSALSGP